MRGRRRGAGPGAARAGAARGHGGVRGGGSTGGRGVEGGAGLGGAEGLHGPVAAHLGAAPGAFGQFPQGGQVHRVRAGRLGQGQDGALGDGQSSVEVPLPGAPAVPRAVRERAEPQPAAIHQPAQRVGELPYPRVQLLRQRLPARHAPPLRPRALRTTRTTRRARPGARAQDDSSGSRFPTCGPVLTQFRNGHFRATGGGHTLINFGASVTLLVRAAPVLYSGEGMGAAVQEPYDGSWVVSSKSRLPGGRTTPL
ncbi:hypothetical protein GCM10010249_05620 [Streptomyces roseolilacinus]|uniref:Uncharacterized protein n=1 Tax=Streptomyces roseolilacinus TaxID=66904 RepID=A0A918EHP1_9ACTN|nr:hypothetical protein GCM10010249_05620 [Streptomyces roseolilacinus]